MGKLKKKMFKLISQNPLFKDFNIMVTAKYFSYHNKMIFNDFWLKKNLSIS